MTETAEPDQDKKLKPLKITCTSADCDNGLHCFKKTRSMVEAEAGNCRYCGADLIDWERLHRRDLDDAHQTFRDLRYELVRHHFWHRDIDLRAINHARRKGRIGIAEAARNRVRKYLAPAEPSFDGRQTPWEGNTIFYAQHAIAACCRTCMEYWHGIPRGTELSTDQINYFVDLIAIYIDERLPDLTENGEKVPFIRNGNGAG